MMNPCIRTLSNNKPQFMPAVTVFALPVDFPIPLGLPIGTIAASCDQMNIPVISIMIMLNVAEGSPEGTYNGI
jgi:hypothetical protein